MDNFKAVYKILSQLEKEMDSEYADIGKFDANALCVSDERWMRYIEMMEDVGYIKGVRIILNDPPQMVHRSTKEAEYEKNKNSGDMLDCFDTCSICIGSCLQ